METLQYNAHLGETTITVNIDREGNVTVPEGTTLENGTYTLSFVNEEGEEEEELNTFFEVEEGKIGRVYVKRDDSNVIKLNIVLTIETLTWAGGLEHNLSLVETTYTTFTEMCTLCGRVHDLNEDWVRGRGEEIMNLVAEFMENLRGNDVIALLKNLLIEEEAEERKKMGYASVEEVQNHINRVTSLLERPQLVMSKT